MEGVGAARITCFGAVDRVGFGLSDTLSIYMLYNASKYWTFFLIFVPSAMVGTLTGVVVLLRHTLIK